MTEVLVRAEGLDVTWDTYPYEWASTRLLIQLPQWVQAGGPGPLKDRLADAATRRAGIWRCAGCRVDRGELDACAAPAHRG